MRRNLLVLGVLAALLGVTSAEAAPLRASYAYVVTPDPALAAAVAALHQAAEAGIAATSATTRNRAYAVIAEMLAPSLKGFSRSLDPLARWNAVDAMPGSVEALTSQLVEQGDVPEGAALPDYRPELLTVLAELTRPGVPLGTMVELPHPACAPAGYGFDRAKVRAFGKTGDVGVGSLRLSASPTALHDRPDATSKVLATLEPLVFMAPIYGANAPGDWMQVTTSDHLTGWVHDSEASDGLSQKHICFGKVGDGYKIVGFFAFGL